jgi:hypothetical protein
MLATVIEFFELFSFVMLSLLVWRISKKPKWKIRAIIYGWGMFVLWAIFWSLPSAWFKGALGLAFLEGRAVSVFLIGGWLYSAIIVGLGSCFDKAKRANKDAD